MKTLYLIRHSKSNWKNQGETDFDRSLNQRGRQDAESLGKYLKSKNVQPNLILSSSANRAYQTAKIIADKIEYPPEKIIADRSLYLAEVYTFLKIIEKIEPSADQVILFSHNPGITMLTNYLGNKIITHVPTSGIVCLTFDIDSWIEIGERTGNIIFFDYPKRRLENTP